MACMVILGVQLCFPPTLQASLLSTQVDMIGLGVKDPAGKPGAEVDINVPSVTVLIVPTWLDTPVSEPPHPPDVLVPVLLPVAGFHPAAP